MFKYIFLLVFSTLPLDRTDYLAGMLFVTYKEDNVFIWNTDLASDLEFIIMLFLKLWYKVADSEQMIIVPWNCHKIYQVLLPIVEWNTKMSGL